MKGKQEFMTRNTSFPGAPRAFRKTGISQPDFTCSPRSVGFNQQKWETGQRHAGEVGDTVGETIINEREAAH
jgi:hypothetical protein